MGGYLIRRLAALVPSLFIASLIVFAAIRLAPGGVVDQMLAQNETATAADRARIEASLGLDRPVWEQYVAWAGNALQGDLGRSLWRNESVSELIAARLPITMELGALALLISISLALPIGVYSATHQDRIGDYIARSASIVLLAVPGFWLGTMVMVFPSVWWRWSPAIEFTPLFEDPLRNLSHMLVPALLLGLSLAAYTMRLTRTMMLEILRQDYVRTARAKGLAERAVVFRHALRNGLIPIVTLIGLQAPILIGGAVIMEQIFVVPGIGSLLLEAVAQRDYPIVTGVFLVVGVAVMLINLIVDLSYGALDPRVRRK